jgi:hypothetical protein
MRFCLPGGRYKELHMFTILKKAGVAAVCLGLISAAFAVPPVPGPVDLTVTDITSKTKCDDTTCTIKNLTVLIQNTGTGDAANAALDYYVSADNTLTTETDRFVHRVSLGKIKAGKTKKRTLGGGLLKQANAVSGQFIFAVIDADNTLAESNDNNNIFSVQIPYPGN